MNIVNTIAPVFIVIFIGFFAGKRGFFSMDFLNRANRLVFHFAIPAMVFSAIAKADLHSQMNMTVILVSMGTVLTVAALAWWVARLIVVRPGSRGSFIQCGFHGNLGYIGFAILFYSLGDHGLTKGAIIAGFVMILQNALAILVLQSFKAQGADLSWRKTVQKSVGNPVILSALAGIIFSLLDLEMPVVIHRSLDIVKGMALPLALVIIGATLSFEQFKSRMAPILVSAFIKLILMPGIALAFFSIFSVERTEYLPGLIILAAPTATLAYVLAREIDGDPALAGSAISFSTLLSAFTYTLWLGIL